MAVSTASVPSCTHYLREVAHRAPWLPLVLLGRLELAAQPQVRLGEACEPERESSKNAERSPNYQGSQGIRVDDACND